MNSLIPVNFARFVLLVIAQVIFFSNIHLHPMLNIYVYPIFILLLPFQTPRWMMIILGFMMGLSIDVFLGSFGMHAAAATLLGYLRPTLINIITPKGTEFEVSPNIYIQGFAWFLIYFSIGYLISLGFYFIIESGTFYNLFWLILKIIVSVTFSVFSSLLLLYLLSRDTRRRHVGR